MPTVWRDGSLRIVIFTDDHPPPHVHVFGDGETKIALGDPDPEVVRSDGVKLAESRRALRIVREQRLYLLERWSGIHG